MPQKFPIAGGSAHEEQMKNCPEDADKTSRARDDLIEAGKKLRRAKTREAKEATAGSGGESGTGVKSCAKAWDNKYPTR